MLVLPGPGDIAPVTNIARLLSHCSIANVHTVTTCIPLV